ncbi:MAG: hypothetical protein R3F33_11185 [Planctomycetota bacterium]
MASPAAYLLKAVRGGDWRSDAAPESQAAAVMRGGPDAERPVAELEQRGSAAAIDLTGGLARLERVLARIASDPNVPGSVKARAATIRETDPARANRLAVDLECALLALED